MQIGEVVAERYQIVATIGRGGMGEVSRCRDLASGQDVALKRIRSDIAPATRGELDQLFYREAAALASLTHPNLVRAHDFGFLDDGARFLVMEYVDGVSLEQLWEHEGILPWDLLASVLDQILLGLAHLHARGLVHRDLKPANVMLSDGPQGPRVTILDLGLAAFRDVAILDIMRPEEELLHSQVARFATPPYCAPEQLLRHAMFLGPTTDLHAVGVLLYQFSTGELPFPGETDAELLDAVLRRTPRRFTPRNGAPEVVGELVRRLLAKRPWQRYDFSTRVRDALEALWKPDLAAEAWHEVGRRHRFRQTEPEVDLGPISDRLAASALMALQVSEVIGRRREQQLLTRAAETVVAGQQRLVALLGEAGVGKSRLGQWLVEQVHERGQMHTLRISYGRSGGALSGILGALEQTFGFAGAPLPMIERALITRWGRGEEARRLARSLARELRPQEKGEFAAPSDAGGGRSALEKRVELALAVLERVRGDQPLLLWLDDVQRAEEEGLALVETLLAAESPVLILITGRPVERRSRLAQLLEGHGCTPMTLAPLGREALEELLATVLAAPGDETAVPPREVLDTLYRASRGNPLFALQQLNSWIQRDQLWWASEERAYKVDPQALAQIAETTEALWRDQIDNLAVDVRLAALAATTLGSSFERALLEQLLEAMGLDPAAATLALVQEQFLIPDRDHLWWQHDTLEEHLSTELLRLDGGESIFLTAVELLRRHPRAHSRAYARLIARALRGAGRPAEAALEMLDCLEQRWEQQRIALHALDDLAELEAELAAPLRGRFLCLRSRAQWAACDYGNAEQDAAAALAWAENQQNLELQAKAYQLLGEAHKARGRYADAAAWLGQALDAWVVLERSQEAANACVALAQGDHYMARYEQAEGWLRRALGIASAAGHELLLAEGRWWLAWVLHDRGRYAEARQEAVQALGSFEHHDSPLGVGQAHWLLATIRGQQGFTADAATHLQTALTRFELAGEQWWLLASAMMQAWLANITGDYPLAMGTAATVREQLAGLDTVNEVANTLLASAAASLASGDLPAAQGFLEEARGLDAPEPSLHQIDHLLRAWLSMRRGDEASANQHLTAAVAIWDDHGLTAWAVPWQLDQLAAYGARWAPGALEGLRSWRGALEANTEPA